MDEVLTMEGLRDKLELWKKAWPKLVRKGMGLGAYNVAREIKRQWSGGVLQKRSGDLVRAVKIMTKLNPISAKVYVKPRQQYKAQVFEGKGTNPNVAKKGKWMQIKPMYAGEYWGRPKEVKIESRPIWDATLQRMKPGALRLIESTIVKGYKKASRLSW